MNVSANRRSLWGAGVVQILGLLVYVAIVELIVALVRPTMPEAWLIPLGAVLAIIPALLWLAFFYVQDHLEPEPKSYVLAVAVLGALLAGAIGEPLINNVFQVGSWIGREPLTEVLGRILIPGFLQSFLIYGAVRFSIYHADEFDQRIDGVVYGTAAGLGYATYLNIALVVDAGGFLDLSSGVVRIVTTALVLGSLGGLLGYFIGRTKFDDEQVWWMPAGLALTAVLNGLIGWLRGEITQAPIRLGPEGIGSGGYSPWPALILAAVVAIVLLVITLGLMRRANRLTLAGADADQQ